MQDFIISGINCLLLNNLLFFFFRYLTFLPQCSNRSVKYPSIFYFQIIKHIRKIIRSFKIFPLNIFFLVPMSGLIDLCLGLSLSHDPIRVSCFLAGKSSRFSVYFLLELKYILQVTFIRKNMCIIHF